MVECEYRCVQWLSLVYQVLIDTWWNVNKLMLAGVFPAALRFNRYMVECESNTKNTGTDTTTVLIDTWWNVNTKTYQRSTLGSWF